MATTTLSKTDLGLRPLIQAAAWCACVGSPVAYAQTWGMDLGVSSQLSWTSNSSFGDGVVGSGPAKSDTILELTPRVQLRSNGGRLRVTGSASLGGVAYTRKTQPSVLEPTADLGARLEAIERLLFVEAGYRAAQTSENPFGVRTDGGSTTNRLTTSQWRLSPVIEGRTPGDIRYNLRSDNTWTSEIGAADAASGDAGGYFGRVSASLEQMPAPFGWRLEADRSRTRYDDANESDLAITTARARISYALADGWAVGVRAGRERNNFDPSLDAWRSIVGVDLQWRPSPRTTLSAFRERRFFGTGWDLAFTHRQPRLAWNLGLTRGVDTTPEELFQLPATNNVAGLLDAMFTTRLPDPVERARAVQEYMRQQGLPNSTPGPINLFSPRLSISTTSRLSVSFTGVRNTVTLSGYATRTEDALDAGPLAGGLPANNNTQRGASVVLSHRLTPQTSLSTALDWSRIRAIDATPPDETTQQGLRVQVSVQAAPLTSTFFGGRVRKIESNVVKDGREGSVFMGLDHRF